MNKIKIKSSKFFVILSLIICIVSSLGSSIIQSNFGNITIKDLSWETESGHKMSGLLLIPDNATKENPAPAIVCSHGWYNNREMQDLNYIEYARRGFVVISIDMYGHGNSDAIAEGTWWNDENNANGLYDAVKLIADLPYVDKERIGVTGHSNGARASRTAVLLDNKSEEKLISSVLLVSNDAIYTDEDGQYINIFEDRDAGIVACQYDEFFHRVVQEDGTISPPREYINQNTAQSFLYFGKNPENLEKRNSYEMYRETINNNDAIRVIYNPNITHPWAHFSKYVVKSSVEFFDESLGAPIHIEGTNQIWQIKVFFNAIGLVGFIMFVTYFAILLLKTEFFATLKSEKPVVIREFKNKSEKLSFWISLFASVIFSIIVYCGIYNWTNLNRPEIFKQPAVYYIGMWAMLCGLFTLITTIISYIWVKKRNKEILVDNGVAISLKNVLLTILLSIIVVIVSYSIIFISDYLFNTDYRIWVLTLKSFTADKLPIIIVYLPLFLIYYIMLSIATNSFNFIKIGKSEKLNLFIVALFSALAPIIMEIFFYGIFFRNGLLPTEIWKFGGSIIPIWLVPMIVVIPTAVIVSRAIYKRTNNPYIGGIIMGLLVTIMSCTNTLTYL